MAIHSDMFLAICEDSEQAFGVLELRRFIFREGRDTRIYNMSSVPFHPD